MVSRSPSASKKPVAAKKTPAAPAAAKKLKPSLAKKSSKAVEPQRKKRKAKEEEEEESEGEEEEEEASEEEDSEDEQDNSSSSEDESSSSEDEDEDMGLSDIEEGQEPRQSVADAMKIRKAPKKKKAPKSEAQEKLAQAAKARSRKRDALERRLQREKFIEGKEASMPIKNASCVTAVRRIGFQMDGLASRFSAQAARLLLDHCFKSLVCRVLPEVREIQMPASKWPDAYKAQKQVRRSRSRALVIEQVYKRHLRATDFLGIDSVETMNKILERFATNPQTLARDQAKQENRKRSEKHAANVARAAVLTAMEDELDENQRAELVKVTLAIEEVEKARAEKKRNEIKANIKMQEEAADHLEKVSLPARIAELRALDGDGEKSASHASRLLAEAVDARDEIKPKVEAKDAELRALLDDKKKLGKELHTEETLQEIAETKAKLKEVRKRFKEEGTLSIGKEADALVEKLGVLQATLTPDATALNDQISIEKKRLANLRKSRNETEKLVLQAQKRLAAVGKNNTKWKADIEAKKARIELHRKTAEAKRIELKKFEKELRGHKQSIKLGNSLASAPMEE